MRENFPQRRYCKPDIRLPQRFVYLLLCVLMLLHAGISHANATPGSSSAAQLMAELDSIRQANNVAALGLVIIKNDQVSLLEVRGLASRESSAAIKADAIFRIGSISKMFAGITAANLDKKKVLSLNTPIQSWATQGTYSNPWGSGLPGAGLPGSGRSGDGHPVTIAQLLEHTAGLQGIDQAEWDFSDPEQPPLSKTLRLFPQARQTQWQPGLHYSYSNAGAGLAGYVMEQATKEAWEDLLRKEVFKPLGMIDTTVFKPANQRLALGYDKDGDTRIPYWHQIFRPFAAINSTLQDMGRFVRMLINHGQLDGKPVFPASVIERVEGPKTSLAARKGLEYGYGLGNYQWLRDGVLFQGHGGDADGYLSKLGYTRSNNTGYFLVITAFQGSTLVEMQKRVEQYLVGNLTVTTSPASETLTGAELDLLTGDYRLVTRRFGRAGEISSEPSMRIYSKGEQLLSQKYGGHSKPLIPLSSEFFRRAGENRATLFIGRGDDGRVYFQEDSDNFRKLASPTVN